MKIKIEGLNENPLQIIEGDSSTIYKISKLGFQNHQNFEEIYCSCLHRNKIRGWYKHKNVEQNFSVIKGAVKFVVYDDRHSSVTQGNIQEIILDQNNLISLHLPVGVWYAFGELSGEEAYILNCLPLTYEKSKSESLPIFSPLIPYVWKNDER